MYPLDLTYTWDAKFVNGRWVFEEPKLCSVTDMLAHQLCASIAPKHSEPPALLTVDQATAYCGGMSTSTWYKYKALGRIPAPVHFCGRTLWRRADLIAWIEDGRPGCVVFEERKRLRKKRQRQPGDRAKVKRDAR